ncbi:PREDICTED: uncharacterized protein LOC106114622 isoform X1 [Papilio xuthus]|uniref:Uncharacterized protein LOC106114622 isoform X1 n=1 Tax=Papilio xuthus TaxID=66420 RepID=A0AAJ6Z1U9_PAPXU|nr:PREDICTED: uncharacterized protein LOC106114622 isoform X1 [Papilio xuthus]
MTNTKQIKITKLFRKGATKASDDCQELQEEIQELEKQLGQKHYELFQIQRNKYRSKSAKVNTLPKKPEVFVRPQIIMLQNSIDTMKKNLELTSMVSGMEVQSYVSGELCCIVYHLQHDSQHQIKHCLEIDMTSGKNEIKRSSFPLGFNFKAIIDEFDNVMKPACLGSIRKALVAYYDRLTQFDALKKLLNIEAKLFKKLDSSYIEISFFAEANVDNECVMIPIVLILDYDINDIRPKTYRFNDSDLSEDISSVLHTQCTVFRKKELHKAFRDAFMDGIGPYKLLKQLTVDEPNYQQQRRKRFRPNKHNPHNDDTFLPEECSDQGDNDDDI